MYLDVMREMSNENKPEIFAHVQNNIGICYYNLAKTSDTESNLIRAKWAYEEAGRMSNIEQYPIKHAETQINLGDTYIALTEFEGNEGDFEKAILSYEEALKIYTAEKHPIYYKNIMLKIDIVNQRMEQ